MESGRQCRSREYLHFTTASPTFRYLERNRPGVLVADLLNSNWIRIAAYLVAAACCAWAGRPHGSDREAGWSRFWLALAVALVVLGIGRELRIGGWIAGEGRTYARDHGWYPDRRPLQRAATNLLFLGGFTVLVFTAVAWRRYWRTHLLAACIFITLVTFVAIRTISYHNIDQVLYNHPYRGVRANSVIELGLNAALIVAALAARSSTVDRIRRSPRASGSPLASPTSPD